MAECCGMLLLSCCAALWCEAQYIYLLQKSNLFFYVFQYGHTKSVSKSSFSHTQQRDCCCCACALCSAVLNQKQILFCSCYCGTIYNTYTQRVVLSAFSCALLLCCYIRKNKSSSSVCLLLLSKNIMIPVEQPSIV